MNRTDLPLVRLACEHHRLCAHCIDRVTAEVDVGRQVMGAILLMPLDALGLELEHEWNQRDNRGRPVGPGSYVVRGTVLTDGPAGLGECSGLAAYRIALNGLSEFVPGSLPVHYVSPGSEQRLQPGAPLTEQFGFCR